MCINNAQPCYIVNLCTRKHATALVKLNCVASMEGNDGL